MAENRYFQKALSDFTFEAACGGAIRHLADSGYTVKQIEKHLDYPAPYARIQKTVWEHLFARGILLKESPGSGLRREKSAYVKEYDSFGKASFRRVVVHEEDGNAVDWKDPVPYSGVRTSEMLLQVLGKWTAENGEKDAYASLDFGLMTGKPGKYEAALAALPEGPREYVSGLPWEKIRVYHKLDARIMEILAYLYEAEQYQGECCFTGTKTILRLE